MPLSDIINDIHNIYNVSGSSIINTTNFDVVQVQSVQDVVNDYIAIDFSSVLIYLGALFFLRKFFKVVVNVISLLIKR